MNLDFAFICDYAEVLGKINALGIGFDTIYASKVPAKHPLFSLVLQLRASPTESGERNLKISLINDDGKELMPPLSGKIEVRKPESGLENIHRIAVAIRDVEFPKYGNYSLRTVIDGKELSSINIKIMPSPKTA